MFVRLLFWIITAHVSFAAVSASLWLARLDRLGLQHDFGWISAFLRIFVTYALPAGFAYVGGLVGFALMPQTYRDALAQTTDDRWAFVVAIVTGVFFGFVLFAIFSAGS
ncbi:MAG: hypothetical protein M3Z41_11060 [Candidatus Eremiobacteraeota bacterium]|nr:hypothetical protein [Candidatus Eremiobacteraeota bacterium]